MTERRIAQVVCQTGRRYDGPRFGQMTVGQFGMFLYQGARHVVAERTSHAGNFQAVGQSVVYEYAAGERKHLCFVLQPPERCGEDKAVVIALEFRAVILAYLMIFLQSEAFVGD